MNVTGLSNYSKETVGLRQSDKIQNQQFRLIYAYPLLFADTISQQNQLSCRKFQTISYLREIIVSNSLNIISMASQIQSDSSQPNNVAQLIGNAILTGGGGSNVQNNVPVINQTVNAYDVQRRVQEKTEQIKKYLESDPRTKKLLPYVEIITLNNLIDVPLIVGTKGFGVLSQAMLYILVIAIVTETPLNKISNVESIIRKLKSTKEKDWFTLLTSLTKDNRTFREKWIENFQKNHAEFRQKIQLNRLTNLLLKGFEGNADKHWYTTAGTQINRIPLVKQIPGVKLLPNVLDTHLPTNNKQEKRDLAAKPEENKKELDKIFNLLKLTKNSLDDVLLNFRFVLDPVLLKNQIGLDTSNNSMETTVTKLSSNQKQIFMQMHDKFMELISTPGSLFLNSAFNTLFPAPTPQYTDLNDLTKVTGYKPTDTNINFLELKEKYFDVDLNKKIQDLIFDTFSKEISNSLSSISPKESQERITLLKAICRSMSEIDGTYKTEIDKFMGSGYSSGGIIRSTNFEERELNGFTSGITRIANTFGSINKRFENTFSQLVNNGPSLLKHAQTTIYSSLEDFFRDVIDRPNYSSMMTYLFGVDDTKVRKIYIPQITDNLFIIFYFFFLYRLQAAICQFMDVIDVEIEAKVNDVFEFPNYTLVLPLDIILGVHAAYVAGSFEKLLTGQDVRTVSNLNDNYVKGIINFIFKRLKVPAIIIIDDKKGEIHYQFMYMSSPEKMSLTTLEAFIKSGA